VIAGWTPRRLLAAGAAALVMVVAACGRSAGPLTMAAALEAVPLRLTGGQTLEVQLAGRQPAEACDPLPSGERARIRDAGLTVSVPAAVPDPATGQVRIVPHTTARYVVRSDGQARAYLDGTLAIGGESDVAAFVGVDLGRTSPVGAARAVTWLARALDDVGAYAAVLRGPAGPPDESGAAWSATAATTDGRVVSIRATGSGASAVRVVPASDRCAYRTAG
jgi:hypothetical protein